MIAFGVFNISLVFSALTYVVALIMPIIWGLILAYIINIPLKAIEGKVLGFMDSNERLRKLRRPIALSFVLLAILAVLALMYFMLAPQVVRIVNLASAKLPGAVRNLDAELNKYGINISEFMNSTLKLPTANPRKVQDTLNTASQLLMHGILNSSNIIGSVFGNIISVFFSVMIVIFVLSSKESLKRYFYKMLYSSLSIEKADKIKLLLKRANKTFTSFIAGQFKHPIIIGLMIYISMLIFSMPYASLISVLSAILSIIPIIGAWIGAIAGFLLILTNDVSLALYFLLLYVIVQTIDGNVIYPKVLGDKIGLPPLWVLMAVVVGQGFFGIFGTLFFIPLTSLVYDLADEHSEKIIKQKGLSEDLFQ